ncbi:MAG TPA: nuclear transport factor 2 family protein [Solirubrobacterales bacterium]|nr:nuclear transport factor 2 family protein [Solirubrobacterales bacterium]
MSADDSEVAGRGGPGGEADRIDLERVRRNYEAFGQRDWDRAQSLMDPEITWQDPPGLAGGGVHQGKEALRRAWQENFEETWEEFSLEAQEVIRSGDLIFVHAVLSGRSRHEALEISMDVFQVWTFRDGLAVRQEAFLDRNAALEAAGL